MSIKLRDAGIDLPMCLSEVELCGDTVTVPLWYPRADRAQKYVVIELMDVRAADGIRISYDFERDGYVIEQASTFGWDADDDVCDSDWQEVAFIQAWAREKEEAD